LSQETTEGSPVSMNRIKKLRKGLYKAIESLEWSIGIRIDKIVVQRREFTTVLFVHCADKVTRIFMYMPIMDTPYSVKEIITLVDSIEDEILQRITEIVYRKGTVQLVTIPMPVKKKYDRRKSSFKREGAWRDG